MKTAIISLTKNGVKTAEKIAGRMVCDRYAFEKYAAEGTLPFSSLSALTAEIFGRYEALVFICAAGIAVRAIAPHLRSKLVDPAVVVTDESGKFAVSLLSGHIGGANSLAERVAEIIGAIPVVTTATDAGGKLSPDSFAKANGLHILEPELVKAVAAAVVNGERVGFYSDYPCENVPAGLTEEADIGVCVSASTEKRPFKATLHLVPKNIALGVGCRKNVDPDIFEAFVLAAVKNAGISFYRVTEIRTIDIKKNERAILDFCRKYGLSLRFYSAEALAKVKGEFSPSDFVLKAVGVDNVCERCAALGGGKIVLPKTAGNGVTLAAAEMEITPDFERKVL